MSEAVASPAERPALRISFRGLSLVMLVVTLGIVAFGTHIYQRFGGYRPLALAHIPGEMRYRARVELGDLTRVPALQPLLAAADPHGARRGLLEAKLGAPLRSHFKEVAFGMGPAPSDFVIAVGAVVTRGQLGATACALLTEEGGVAEPLPTGGCRMKSGAVVQEAEDGVLLLASRAELIEGRLSTPDLGDRLGFSGPTVRGIAPPAGPLRVESERLSSELMAAFGTPAR